MTYDINIREEELKNKIAKDYFWSYDTTKIIGNVDFCVAMHQSGKVLSEQESLLWAEAKKGVSNIYNSLVQLILTIGKARTFDKFLPPTMLGAFDTEKIAFIPYNDIHDIFYVNDFNWNVAPSNYDTKEFRIVYDKVKSILDQNTLLYFYDKDDKELRKFIKTNFVVGNWGLTKTRIDKNNFMIIYNKWLKDVKPSIAADWDLAKKTNIIDGDFYLADLLSEENFTLKEKLFVLLKKDHYQFDRKLSDSGFFTQSTTGFKDNQVAHNQFWNKYERPPKEEYWDYIVERRDLLVPQDVRERKGSFFTPQIWVELSQKYLTDVLGEDWQDEYYIWDCAAGTGNLLTGLTNKRKIWASTLDKQDVEVMKDRIKNGANLFEDHVFQFDFLNDEFTKLPKPLQDILNDPEKRKKLVIYINPPYAEAGDTKQRTGTGKNKDKTTTNNAVYLKYRDKLGKASNELFTQFLIRIWCEIPECIIAQYSTIKHLQSYNFAEFRSIFKPKLQKIFLIPANTFDNVRGSFPIGFHIWNCSESEKFEMISADIFEKNGELIGSKMLYNLDIYKQLSSFGKFNGNSPDNAIGHFAARGNDFQNQNAVFIDNVKDEHLGGGIHIFISILNLKVVAISFTVRHILKATWLNDRDQFLYPNDGWQEDKEFQNDCLAFTLFHSQNKISANQGTNHWIPFTEDDLGSTQAFESNFMSKFINGKLKLEVDADLYNGKSTKTTEKLEFSPEAKAVFDAGRELWRYYHKQADCNVNASLYDIREHFQGRNAKGRMNSKSSDETYTKLIADLRDTLKILAQKIEPKVYEYGFLKK